MSDPCVYNPEKKRPCYASEVHAEAVVIVGASGQWRLCESCASLPEFKKYRKRVTIRRAKKEATGDERWEDC